MLRLRLIEDADLRARLTAAIAARRGMRPEEVPDWLELDDADVVDLLNDSEPDRPAVDDPPDAYPSP